jgi:hypothetical protein
MRQTTITTCWMKIALLLALVAYLALPLPAWGQSCALCYTQAAGAGPRMIQDLKSGILVLIFPPMGICIGLIVMSYKKRNLSGEQTNSKRKSDRSSDLGW